MADPEDSSNAGERSKLKHVLWTAAAVVVVLIAVIVIAEPFAKNSAGAAVAGLNPQGCVKDPSSSAVCDQSTAGLTGANSVAVSPDGTSVYVASSTDSAVVRFDRNTSTGALTPQGCIEDTIVGGAGCGSETYGLGYASSVVVSPDGESVYVAGPTENAVVRFDRNTSTGALTPVECVQDNDEFVPQCAQTTDGLSDVEAVAVSPDGKSVYAGSNEDDAIVEFGRDTETDIGALTTSDEACIEDSPLDGGEQCSRSTNGLDGITALAVSPDNRSVYATSQFDSAVVRFDRNTSTGALTPQGCIDDSEGPGTCSGSSAGLLETWSVAVSPDGNSVYAVGRDSDAIVRFDRESSTGALTARGCIESYGEKCAEKTDGMFGPQGVVVSPDGGQVYVSALLGSVVGFDRAPSGALTSAGCVTDPDYEISGCEATADGLDFASGVAFSPSGDSLYVTSQFDDAIVRFGHTVSGVLAGRVFDAEANPVANAPVEICRTGGGPCIARFTNSSGDYRASGLADGEYLVTARPPVGLEAESGQAGPVTVSAGSTATQDVTLGEAVVPPPAGTEVGTDRLSEGGIPAVRWGQEAPLTTHACPNATSAEFRVVIGGNTVAGGAMVESSSGTYVATIPSLQPHTGTATVRIEIACPSEPPVEIAFGIYIDPSGVVRNASTGAPIAGATVTLLRSESAGGPFEQVPDGSAIMSPGNRSNPDTTDPEGRFGWDVVAGYYRVRATASGCNSAETGVLTIPPPVTDLKLELSCPTGEPTTPGGEAAPPPATASSNNFSFGSVKLNTKKGTATLVVKVPGPGSLVLSGKQVAKVRKTAAAAANVKLTVKPKGSAKETLAKKGTVKVKVRVDYTPTGGAKGSKTKTVKLVRKG